MMQGLAAVYVTLSRISAQWVHTDDVPNVQTISTHCTFQQRN